MAPAAHVDPAGQGNGIDAFAPQYHPGGQGRPAGDDVTMVPAHPALPIVHSTPLLAFCVKIGQYEPATHGTGA